MAKTIHIALELDLAHDDGAEISEEMRQDCAEAIYNTVVRRLQRQDFLPSLDVVIAGICFSDTVQVRSTRTIDA